MVFTVFMSYYIPITNASTILDPVDNNILVKITRGLHPSSFHTSSKLVVPNACIDHTCPEISGHGVATMLPSTVKFMKPHTWKILFWIFNTLVIIAYQDPFQECI